MSINFSGGSVFYLHVICPSGLFPGANLIQDIFRVTAKINE
jgi:hypothetical protein